MYQYRARAVPDRSVRPSCELTAWRVGVVLMFHKHISKSAVHIIESAIHVMTFIKSAINHKQTHHNPASYGKFSN